MDNVITVDLLHIPPVKLGERIYIRSRLFDQDFIIQ